ncbi:uncharacterized protein PAC_13860 [Phialocephala subalpina]|uniref:5-methylcytosine G/T mismatch-specific DNA glycosylase n=1 Tax=Phialocephala subalpina TaxID=576137 RepID=A0A1L7XFZ3_9HELO|nr:uncharacterized protein PAC_13860 [Phialocephala subalpina]
MAYKDRDGEVEERPSEKRHREKKEKDPNRTHRSSRSSRPKVIDPETGEPVRSSHRRRKDKERESEKDRDSEPSTSMADLVPELARTASAPGATSRSSLPYPSFNKAHSKEAVNSRDDIGLPGKENKSPYTPESTDVGEDKAKTRSTEAFPTFNPQVTVPKDGRPPSPPETDVSQRKATPNRMSRVQEDTAEEETPRPNSRTSGVRSPKKDKDDRSRLSTKSKNSSKASTAIKSPTFKHKVGASTDDLVRDSGIGSGDSIVTSVAPKRDAPEPPFLDTGSSPASAQDSSPQTPTQTPVFPPPASASVKPTPSSFIHFENPEAESSAYDSPQPPPPPPPPAVPINIPRVDYLMQNGGLVRPTSRNLPSEVEKVFVPFSNILDQYETVINKHGSLAVATGYRSVARRLLDRLENVFNRDLSSEGCVCVMCQHTDPSVHEGSRGLGWGEVLEWVSGRRELPVWPAFDFATLGVKAGEGFAGLGISQGTENIIRPGSPVKIDPDIAEEFREHYLAQNARKKAQVDRWLSSCPQTAATPPQEVDDETLSFAILTHLDQADQPIYNALIAGSTILQPVRAPSATRKPRSEFMVKTVHSLQRLYKLQRPPRDPEAAIYLLKYPQLHNLLATLSSIVPSEWEILTSGRFDGFLWSGADSESASPSPAPSRGPTPANGIPYRGPMSPGAGMAGMRQPSGGSRTTTPFSPMRNQTFSPSMGPTGFQSRGPTPLAQQRQPVSNDEETEIQVLAEVEREIYLGMEALEDAFEALHRKAEMVRRALRERSAGLSMSLQNRRTCDPGIISSNTPGPQSAGLGPGFERPNWAESSEMHSESDWDVEDQSELWPDDSASQISASKHRRPERRHERRTPAIVEESELED